MTAPTTETRNGVYLRDGFRCVICGALEKTFQHRRAVGMGGSRNVPTAVDGLTLCLTCNVACERELHTKALANGWKVRRWVMCPERVAVYFPHEFAWYRLEGLNRILLTPPASVSRMDGRHRLHRAHRSSPVVGSSNNIANAPTGSSSSAR